MTKTKTLFEKRYRSLTGHDLLFTTKKVRTKYQVRAHLYGGKKYEASAKTEDEAKKQVVNKLLYDAKTLQLSKAQGKYTDGYLFDLMILENLLNPIVHTAFTEMANLHVLKYLELLHSKELTKKQDVEILKLAKEQMQDLKREARKYEGKEKNFITRTLLKAVGSDSKIGEGVEMTVDLFTGILTLFKKAIEKDGSVIYPAFLREDETGDIEFNGKKCKLITE